ncbi:MAG: site-2 protease family protein [Leptospiraceae bacterium]|nr:site-2 protease family protein [Leptospiraceae bacterium]
MKWSLYVGKPWGIRVYIHWTFLLLLGWIIFAQLGSGTERIIRVLILTALLFVSVLLHEFGHALVARRFKILTRDIVLLPIGGMARLRKMPEDPKAEFWVALAGPLVNAAIAGLLFVALLVTSGLPAIPEKFVLGAKGFNMTENLMWANALLAAFNLVPAFPMDGGRVLRAFLGFRMSHEKATAIAAQVGQALGIGFVILGFLYSLVFIFIGIFVYLGASSESSSEQIRSSLRAYTVSNILIKHYSALKPDDGIMTAVELLLSGQEQEFLVMDGKKVVGVITKKEIFAGLSEHGNHVTVKHIMLQNFPLLRMETTLEDALRMFNEKSCPIAPVFRGNALVGVLDRDNIQELLTLNQAMKQYLDSPIRADSGTAHP